MQRMKKTSKPCIVALVRRIHHQKAYSYLNVWYGKHISRSANDSPYSPWSILASYYVGFPFSAFSQAGIDAYECSHWGWMTHICISKLTSIGSKIRYWLHTSHVISETNYPKSWWILFPFFGDTMGTHLVSSYSETPRAEHFPGICPMSSDTLLNAGLIHINDHIMLWPCPTSHRVLYSYPALTAGNLSLVMLSSP